MAIAARRPNAGRHAADRRRGGTHPTERSSGGRVSLTELMALLAHLRSVPSEGVAGFSELDHGLQCAHELTLDRPADMELQVAGLLHDVGHEFGPDELHGVLGAARVRPLFGDRVADLIEAHVVAKRYLAATDPAYGSVLSGESHRTLVVQGGPLSA